MPKKLSPYLQRLQAVNDYLTTHQNTKFSSNKKKKLSPKVVFLDIEQGVTRAGDTIAQGWPVVTDYGSTYGTAFPTHIRQEIAMARKEKAPYAVVSLVTINDEVEDWFDKNRLHPLINLVLAKDGLKILEGVSFIRFPANDQALAKIDRSCINEKKEIQVFIVEHDDPLMRYLKNKHGIAYIAVRSSNITGNLEETSVKGAMKYAAEIAAPLFVMRSLNSFYAQIEDEEQQAKQKIEKLHRQRIGSQPIIVFPKINEEPIITIVRAGNTHPQTLIRLLGQFTEVGLEVVYKPEKKSPPGRQYFQVDESITDPVLIKSLLLKASNLS